MKILIMLNCMPDQHEKKIKVGHLMNVFDQVRTEIGIKPILSKQLAKGALAWIPNEKLIDQIQDVEVHNSPLMSVIRNVHTDISDNTITV